MPQLAMVLGVRGHSTRRRAGWCLRLRRLVPQDVGRGRRRSDSAGLAWAWVRAAFGAREAVLLAHPEHRRPPAHAVDEWVDDRLSVPEEGTEEHVVVGEVLLHQAND